MRRDAMQELYDWKEKSTRKPLIIRGARQVGKTWLMKEFAATAYKQFAYINFEDNEVFPRESTTVSCHCSWFFIGDCDASK